MTELERKALMGDKEAQEECTRRRIVLPCPRCGGNATVEELHTGGKPIYAVVCENHFCGAYGCAHSTTEKAISYWNTRPAPPVGRCGECEHWADWGACGRPENGWDVSKMNADDFCSRFEPKGDEKNA